MKSKAAMLRITTTVGLLLLSACSVGKPMAIPEPESQLTPKPGLFTEDNGEWTIYRK
jgi:hypothetical protein